MEYGINKGLHAAIRGMVAASQKSYAQVSREMGRARTFLSVMFRDSTTPRLDLMAKIANACGYALLLVGHGEALEVTPEPCEDSPCTVAKRYDVSETQTGLILGTDVDMPSDAAGVAPVDAVDDATRRALMDAGADELLSDLIEYLGDRRQTIRGGAELHSNDSLKP